MIVVIVACGGGDCGDLISPRIIPPGATGATNLACLYLVSASLPHLSLLTPVPRFVSLHKTTSTSLLLLLLSSMHLHICGACCFGFDFPLLFNFDFSSAFNVRYSLALAWGSVGAYFCLSCYLLLEIAMAIIFGFLVVVLDSG
ncbi:hypothetical protein EV426DRAFT_617095 [Tirmania nivea]|nr:hypothetical protein EV426DRAFT_617095 [Tirmania nivea]